MSLAIGTKRPQMLYEMEDSLWKKLNEVVEGKKSPEQVLEEFLTEFPKEVYETLDVSERHFFSPSCMFIF